MIFCSVVQLQNFGNGLALRFHEKHGIGGFDEFLHMGKESVYATFCLFQQ